MREKALMAPKLCPAFATVCLVVIRVDVSKSMQPAWLQGFNTSKLPHAQLLACSARADEWGLLEHDA
jgi:hypothetical protein